MQKKKLFIVFVSFLVALGNFGAASTAHIDVYCDREIGALNRKVFGNNFIGYDPMTYENWAREYYGYSDYGAGIWNPKLKQSVKEVIELAKSSGMSVVRFPGGCGTHHYNWKNSIGKDRVHFLYGLDEFLKTCKEIGAEPVITVSYFTGDEFDAAELVEYLNAPIDQNHKWAMVRANNGHSQPYKVKYFEIGNEIYHGDHQRIKNVLPRDYAQRYLKYYKRMKSIDPSIKIGAVLCSEEWDRKVAGIIKDKLDFGIVHIYLNGGFEQAELERERPEIIFKRTLAEPVLDLKFDLKKESQLLKEQCGKDVPLAVTEYNCGFEQEHPVPYRHCLGTALVNAELLAIFMRQEFNILMANYWNFNNSYTGMIANGFDDNYIMLYKPYFKRPTYYVFELYKRCFGEQLIQAEVDSESYKINGVDIPYLSVNASRSSNGAKIYLIVINKSLETKIDSLINLKDFNPSPKGNVWILNGPSIDATNEIVHNNVRVVHRQFEIKYIPFTFSFEPHSLTAIEIEQNER